MLHGAELIKKTHWAGLMGILFIIIILCNYFCHQVVGYLWNYQSILVTPHIGLFYYLYSGIWSFDFLLQTFSSALRFFGATSPGPIEWLVSSWQMKLCLLSVGVLGSRTSGYFNQIHSLPPSTALLLHQLWCWRKSPADPWSTLSRKIKEFKFFDIVGTLLPATLKRKETPPCFSFLSVVHGAVQKVISPSDKIY